MASPGGTSGGSGSPWSPTRNNSMASNFSSGSAGSTGKRSVLSRASSVGSQIGSFLGLRRGSKSSIATTAEVAEVISVVAGDICEVCSLVTLRKGEDLSSEQVREMPIGTTLKILQVGELRRRIKVTCPTNPALEGWISTKTKLNEPLIIKRGLDMAMMIDGFEKGGRHEIKSLVTVRQLESMDSSMLTQLKPGTIVNIVEVGKLNNRRVKIRFDSAPCVPGEGWISTATTITQGLLLGKVSDGYPSKSKMATMGSPGSYLTSGQGKAKAILEAARAGDLEAMRRAVEHQGGMFGKLAGKPQLNCSDIRGKTALIYASALGHKSIVEYLLAKRFEVEIDVNHVDDTSKSALHHAAKKKSGAGGVSQVDIVDFLLSRKATLETKDHNDCTPLMFAVANGDTEVVRRLIKSGANVNARDVERNGPLDYAIKFRQATMERLLRESGALECSEKDSGSDEDGVGARGAIWAAEASEYAAPAFDGYVAAEEAKNISKHMSGDGSPTGAVEEGDLRSKKSKKKKKYKRHRANSQQDIFADAVRVDIGDGEMMVEDQAGGADPREAALRKLRYLVEENVDSYQEIQDALSVADDAYGGHLPEDERRVAADRIKELKHRSRVETMENRLRTAIETGSAEQLNSVIMKARNMKVDQRLLADAEGVLRNISEGS